MRLAADLRAAVLQAAFQGKISLQDTQNESGRTTLELLRSNKKTVIIKAKAKGVTPQFAIPKNWVWCFLGECIELLSGADFETSLYNSVCAGIPYMTGASNIQNGLLVVNRWTESPKCVSHRGDLLLVCKGAGYGKTVFNNIGDIHIARQFMAISGGEALNLHYVKNYLDLFFNCNKPKGKGLIPGIDRNMVLFMPFPLAPIEEQNRIVDRINELMPAINEYEEMENRLIALKEAFPGNLRDAILQAAVLGQLSEQDERENSSCLVDEIQTTKKRLLSEKLISRDNSCKTEPIDESDIDLPEIPSNWTWVRLGNLCSKIGAGSTPTGGSKVYVKSGVKFLREQNIHNSGLVMEGLVYITDEINTSMIGSQVQAKDILVNITGASIGRNALVPDDFDAANVNQHVLIVRLIDDRLRHYIHLCLQSPFIFNQMMDKQMGDKPGLSATKVANFLIPIPPLAEQQRIVERLDAILPLCDTLAEEI